MNGGAEFADEVMRTLARGNRWANMRAQLEIPAAQVRMLALIEDLEPARITSLAAADHTSQPGATALVNRLVDAGWVQRLSDESDARAVPVGLTDAGRAVLGRLRAARAEVLAPALDRLTDDELEQLRRGLALLSRLLDD